MAVFESWTVLPHQPIEKLAENLWTVRGTMPDPTVQRRMTVIRRADGTLILHNGIALADDEMRDLESFGTPHTLIVPNGFHRQDAKIFKQRYPSLRVFAPKGAVKSVSKVIAVDGTYADLPADDSVRFEYIEGAKQTEGVGVVRSKDGTSLIFNDAIMNIPRARFPMSFLLAPTGQPAAPRMMRWMLFRDNRTVATSFERYAAIADLRRVLMSHGDPFYDRPSETLKAVAAGLRS